MDIFIEYRETCHKKKSLIETYFQSQWVIMTNNMSCHEHEGVIVDDFFCHNQSAPLACKANQISKGSWVNAMV